MPRNALQHRYRLWLLAGLLLVFGLVFFVRGPVRAVQGGADLAHVYVASALWLEGGNPYDGAACVERMRQAGYPNPEHVSNGSFYPPSTLAALSPLGLLSWDAARLVWLALNLVACAVLVWSLAGWLRLADARSRWVLAGLIVVAWGPVATSLSLGQLSVVAGACVFAGLLLLDRGRAWQAGLLIGVACLVKPQLGLGFVLLVALRRQWWALGYAMVLIAGVSVIGVVRLMATTPEWMQKLSANIAADQDGGAVLDASLTGPMRYQMIDLHPLLHLVLPGAWVGLAALLAVGLLAAVALWRLLRMGLERYALLAAAGVGVLVLMPVYHRYYDAVLLLPLVVLVCNVLVGDRRDRTMWVIAVAMLLFVFPLPAMFATVEHKGVLPEALVNSWAWKHLALQCQSWCLLVVALSLVGWTVRRPHGQGTDPATSMSSRSAVSHRAP